MITMSFPGLGIQEFSVNPVVLSFGKIEIRWYGLIIATGILLALLYCAYRAKHEGISVDDLLDIALITIPCSIVGARLYYVLTSLDQFDGFLDMIAIWNGGLAIYGAIIAGAITILCVCRFKKINPLKMLDVVAPAVMIGQIMGRWGNFFNGEAYGAEVMEGNLLYFLRMGLVPNIESATQMHYFHPTFLYESLWNLAGFLLIHFLYKKKLFDGQVLLMYLTWYGFGRMLIEGLRTDSLYVGVFRISQVVGFLCFVIGGILLTVNLVKARRAKLTAGGYEATYSKISGASAPEGTATESASPESDEESAEASAEEMDREESEEPLSPPPSKEELKKMEDRFRHLFDDPDSDSSEDKEEN